MDYENLTGDTLKAAEARLCEHFNVKSVEDIPDLEGMLDKGLKTSLGDYQDRVDVLKLLLTRLLRRVPELPEGEEDLPEKSVDLLVRAAKELGRLEAMQHAMQVIDMATNDVERLRRTKKAEHEAEQEVATE